MLKISQSWRFPSWSRYFAKSVIVYLALQWRDLIGVSHLCLHCTPRTWPPSSVWVTLSRIYMQSEQLNWKGITRPTSQPAAKAKTMHDNRIIHVGNLAIQIDSLSVSPQTTAHIETIITGTISRQR